MYQVPHGRTSHSVRCNAQDAFGRINKYGCTAIPRMPQQHPKRVVILHVQGIYCRLCSLTGWKKDWQNALQRNTITAPCYGFFWVFLSSIILFQITRSKTSCRCRSRVDRGNVCRRNILCRQSALQFNNVKGIAGNYFLIGWFLVAILQLCLFCSI